MGTHMGGKCWTTKEQERLRELYPVTDNFELAAMFHRSAIGIEKKATLLGLRKAKKVKCNKFRNWKEIAANYRPVLFGRAV